MWELYERNLVPIYLEPFARDLLQVAALQPGDQVLDVGCGTGIVARLATASLGSSGRVVGVDVSPDMLAVARAYSGSLPVEWEEGDAHDLPFSDASFDVVLCQQVLQFLPDRLRALQEMRRVLRPEGRAVVSVWSSIQEAPGFGALAHALATHVGPESAAAVRERGFGFSDPEALAAALQQAGFNNISVSKHQRVIHYPSVEDFVLRYLEVLAALVPEFAAAGPAGAAKVVGEVTATLPDHRLPGGSLSLPLATNVAVGRAP
ncbi:MAG: methyltransferase domain-containing protein [Actinomycetota bacterium]|nr:methyltransferase domain-containing protein [Actinomycetota bacterium]